MMNTTTAVLSVLIACLVSIVLQEAQSAPAPAPELDTSSEMYLYSWPLVISYLTRRQMFYLPDNLMLPLPVFPNPNLTAIVKPNVDTLYDAGWLVFDKADELTLTVPDTNNGLYYLFPLMDAWTNIVSSPGWRTTGKNAKKILIKGPFSNTTDEDPDQYDLIIRSPTSIAYILGRTNVPDPDNLRPTQEQMFSYRLIPNGWTPPATTTTATTTTTITTDENKVGGKAKDWIDSMVDKLADKMVGHSNPVEHIFAMNAREYYGLFAKLFASNPPILPQDESIVARMTSQFGLTSGQPFDYASLSVEQRIELTKGMEKGIDLLKTYPAPKKNGWTMPDMRTGNFSDNYYLRSYIAYALYAANLPQDAVYFVSDMFEGAGNSYEFEFFPPQTNAFWSITLYSDEGYLVANEDKKYSVSSQQSELKVRSDGSVHVTVSMSAPTTFSGVSDPAADVSTTNWLPAPQQGEGFQLTFRVYWPGDDVLQKKWCPPVVEKIVPVLV